MTKELRNYLITTYYSNAAHPETFKDGWLEALYSKEVAAYKAGYEAGKQTKWHKVADGDLPRQNGHTCFSIDVLADNRKWVYYSFMNNKWFCGNKETKITAWCEIPKYEETE